MFRTSFRLSRRQFERLLGGGLVLPLVNSTWASQLAVGNSQLNITTANNEFAIALYRDIDSANAGKNHFVSPFSIESALTMTSEGARGETAAEMGKALRFPIMLKTNDAAQPWDLVTLRQEIREVYRQFASADDPNAARLRGELNSLRDSLTRANSKAHELLSQQRFKEAQSQQAEAARLATRINQLAVKIDQYELRIANAIWTEKSLPINPNFVQIVSEFYGSAGAFPVDFIGAPESQRESINRWVSDRTREKIKDVIPMGLINSMTRMVLANAIYFKGTWASPFDESQTEVGLFTPRTGKMLNAFMMSQRSLKAGRYGAFQADGSLFETPKMIEEGAEERTGYPGGDGFQIVELPYNGDQISMLILLPRSTDGLGALTALLTADRLKQWDQALATREFQLKLPRFKLETNYSLKDSLVRMGMVRAFDDRPGVADFSGLSSSRDPQHQLYISAVLHKAFVEVNEKGTEAAAATVVIMAPTGAPLRRPFVPSFNADHPFLFLIRDKLSGLILFIGKVESP